MGRVKKLVLGLLVAVAAVILAVIGCELALRLMGAFPESQSTQSAAIEAQVAAHTFANTHAHYEFGTTASIYTEGRTTPGEIDDFGYLGTRTKQIQPNDMLVFGDSFAYGFGVREQDAFAAKLGAYNAGLWGEAFPMHARVFKRVTPVLRPKRAIWVIYPPHLVSCTALGWYTRRNISVTYHPFLFSLVKAYNRLKISSLVLKVTGWGLNRPDYYSLEWNLYNSGFDGYQEGYRRFEESTEEITSIAAAAEIELVVVFVPSKNRIALELQRARPSLYPAAELDPNVPTLRMARILEAHGVNAVHRIDLMDLMRARSTEWKHYYFETDAHFNEAGNAAVAELLKARLNNLSHAEH